MNLYVNLKKATNVIDNVTFKEGKKYEAFTQFHPSYEEYAPSPQVKNYIKALKKIANEKLSQSDCQKIANKALADYLEFK